MLPISRTIFFYVFCRLLLIFILFFCVFPNSSNSSIAFSLIEKKQISSTTKHCGIFDREINETLIEAREMWWLCDGECITVTVTGTELLPWRVVLYDGEYITFITGTCSCYLDVWCCCRVQRCHWRKLDVQHVLHVIQNFLVRLWCVRIEYHFLHNIGALL